MVSIEQSQPALRKKPRSVLAQWFFRIDTVALAFYLLVMVRLASGEADSEATRAITAAAVESGDIVKQISYTALFGLLTVFWVSVKGLRVPRSVGLIPILLLVWILLSTYWSPTPNVAIRRGVLLIFVFFSLAIVVDLLGPTRSLFALYKAMAICTVMSILVVFLVPSVGRHPMTELDVGIAGGWRGIFIHKNTAGAVIAMSALMFFNFAITRGKKIDWVLFALALFFVFGSKAKTALGLTFLVLPVLLVYRLACADIRFRALTIVLTILGVMAVASAAIGYSEKLTEIFTDPNSFTGRVAIWQAAWDYAMDHFWTGSGYSSLWGVGSPPVIMEYARFPFLEFISHSHNGYLEMFATTGFVGLVMAVWFSVAVPFYKLMRMANKKHAHMLSILFAVWFFAVLVNFMETQLFTRDREIWVFFFSAILILQQLYSEEYKSPSRFRIVRKRSLVRRMAIAQQPESVSTS